TAVATRLRSARGGAGLELELSDARPLDALPADLRRELPPRGLVNFLEAQALIGRLEELVCDAAFVSAARAWPQRQPVPSAPVAVIGLYPAQAELLRLLARRSPVLTNGPLTFEVGTPAAFRQRDAFAALVSLTRSHTHRAVSFGEGPAALTLAMTRASGRLLLFADPGTLARRTQWQGPLGHLDEGGAGRERASVCGVGALPGGGGRGRWCAPATPKAPDPRRNRPVTRPRRSRPSRSRTRFLTGAPAHG